MGKMRDTRAITPATPRANSPGKPPEHESDLRKGWAEIWQASSPWRGKGTPMRVPGRNAGTPAESNE